MMCGSQFIIPVETAIDTGSISGLTDAVSVKSKDGCTHKDVECELEIHHPSPGPHLTT